MNIKEIPENEQLFKKCAAETKGDARKTRLRRMEPTQCGMQARYRINGKLHCVRHAQAAALRWVMKNHG